jgi:hypothetical protein
MRYLTLALSIQLRGTQKVDVHAHAIVFPVPAFVIEGQETRRSPHNLHLRRRNRSHWLDWLMNPSSWSQFGGKGDIGSITGTAHSGDPSHRLLPAAATNKSASMLQSLPPNPTTEDPQPAGTMNCIRSETSAATEPGHIPRRNLSEAFEELYIAPTADNAGTPGMKPTAEELQKVSSNLISPTGVADFCADAPSATSTDGPKDPRTESDADNNAAMPFFNLHPDLKRDLSQAVINRVSVYGVIHDINKEASAMAANDDSAFSRASTEETSEDCSPLVEAVKGPSANQPVIDAALVRAALIDEEQWLLSAIATRGQDENRPIQACPPTFLQAMGEREYENPLTSLSNGSRTQLWKPSRSWWEAKSGKNPWIEPKSHNKRWR